MTTAGHALAGRRFATPAEVAIAVRRIRDDTGVGGTVADEHLPFLFALLAHHDEWEEKSAGGVDAVVVPRGGAGRDRFRLERGDGSAIDISFSHALARLPYGRTRSRRADSPARTVRAARAEIADQLIAFRRDALPSGTVCEVEGKELLAVNVDVDHVPPVTFEKLLSTFCVSRGIELADIAAVETDGRSVRFADELLGRAWRRHHGEHARLGLITRIGHRRVAVRTRRRG